jgi:hypothetical protein
LLHICFHANISYQSVQFVERLLVGQIGRVDASAFILLSTGGGDSAAGIGLYHVMKALPYPVHVHGAGICASGGVPLMLAAKKRTCTLDTMFMIHGSKASDGSLSPQVGIMTGIFKEELGWDQAKLDQYFSSVDEKWFSSQSALSEHFVQKVEPFAFPPDANVHVVPN